MSNLIKYTFVNFDKEDSYVIDYEKKEKPVEEPELQMTQVPDPEGFEAGVPVKNFDQVWEEKQEEAIEQARVVLEEADKEAAQNKSKVNTIFFFITYIVIIIKLYSVLYFLPVFTTYRTHPSLYAAEVRPTLN